MSYDTKTDTTEQTNRSMEGRVRRPRQTKTMVVPSANYNNLPAEVPRSEKNPGHQNKVNQNRKGIKKTNKSEGGGCSFSNKLPGSAIGGNHMQVPCDPVRIPLPPYHSTIPPPPPPRPIQDEKNRVIAPFHFLLFSLPGNSGC